MYYRIRPEQIDCRFFCKAFTGGRTRYLSTNTTLPVLRFPIPVCFLADCAFPARSTYAVIGFLNLTFILLAERGTFCSVTLKFGLWPRPAKIIYGSILTIVWNISVIGHYVRELGLINQTHRHTHTTDRVLYTATNVIDMTFPIKSADLSHHPASWTLPVT